MGRDGIGRGTWELDGRASRLTLQRRAALQVEGLKARALRQRLGDNCEAPMHNVRCAMHGPAQQARGGVSEHVTPTLALPVICGQQSSRTLDRSAPHIQHLQVLALADAGG